jgi:hypothetical protein
LLTKLGKSAAGRKLKPQGTAQRKPLLHDRVDSLNGSGSDDGSPAAVTRFGAGAAKGRTLAGGRAKSFRVSCEVNKKNMSREAYVALKKEERLAQSAAARANIAAKRCNPKVSRMYGVLGLDSCSPPDADGNNTYEAKSSHNDYKSDFMKGLNIFGKGNPRKGEPSYGLGPKLFMSYPECLQVEHKMD